MASNSEEYYLDLLSLAAQTKDPYFLLQGNRRTGKTSVLFHQAILASAEGREVLLISPIVPRELPALPPGVSPQPEHTKLIQLRYPGTPRDLIQLLAAVHESSVKPGLVLLDCLEIYARGEGAETEISKLAKILALLRDAADFWCFQTGKNSIPIFVSSEIHHQVVSKWLPHSIKIEREGEMAFKLTTNSPVKVHCKYSLENNQFVRLSQEPNANED